MVLYGFALIHGYKADKNGNVLVPSYDDRMVAQAADKVIVTVEEIVDYDLGEDPRGGYVIPWPFVNTVVLMHLILVVWSHCMISMRLI